jgi:hypothetical protein
MGGGVRAGLLFADGLPPPTVRRITCADPAQGG